MKNLLAKKYYNILVRALAALMLSAVTLLLVYAFGSGWLPYSADGDAFDTIYAIEDPQK